MRLTTPQRMTTRKTTPTEPDPRRLPNAMIGGIPVVEGAVVKVAGLKGVFRFCYVWTPDGSLACWDDKRHRMRAFRASDVTLAKPPRKT
jgi:hypothetical protein